MSLRRESSSTPSTVSEDGVKQLVMAYKASKTGAVSQGWKPKPGYVYAQVRAISARINQNYDAWPSSELKKAYRTFINRPIFVNHQNHDPSRARGKVIAARYEEHGDDKFVTTIMEVDAKRFPKLAKVIRDGSLDSVSMGVEAGFTICSACGNKAVDEPDFCDHVRNHKGKKISVTNKKTGKTEKKLVYEDCYKLGFFELSWVFDPADETAMASRVMVAGKKQAVGLYDPDEHWGLSHSQDGLIGWGHSRADAESQLQEIADAHEAGKAVDNPDFISLIPPSNHKLKEQIRNWDPDTKQDPFDPRLIGAQRRATKVAARDDEEDRSFVIDNDNQDVYEVPDESALFRKQYGPAEVGNSAGSNYSGGDGSGIPGYGDAKEMPQTKPLYDELSSQFPDNEIGTFRVDDYHEHDHGAMDFMTTDPAVAATVRQKSFDAGAPYVLWQQQQWNADGSTSPMEDRGSPTQNHMDHVHIGPISASNQFRLAYGEVEVPEDIDTLRDDENDSLNDYEFVEPVDLQEVENPFHHYLESPDELSGPDFQQTNRFDSQQEAEGLDGDRLVENFGDVEGDPQFEDAPNRRMTMGRKRYADDHEALEELEEVLQEDLDGDGEDGEDPDHAAIVLDDEDADDDGELDDEDDDDLVDQDGDGQDCDGDECVEDGPPWADDESELRHFSRRSARSRRRARNKGTSQKGSGMSLTSRTRVATKGRRHADTSGHVDGGPYGGPYGNDADQGDLEDVYLSQVPGAEAVEAPTGDESKITNTPTNLVAMRRTVQAQAAVLQRNIAALQSAEASTRTAARPYRQTADFVLSLPVGERPAAATKFAQVFKAENPRFSPRKFFAAVGLRLAEAVEEGDVENPELSGTDEQGLRGDDFDSVSLDDVQTQPKDASRKAFAAFDAWIRSATGRTASAHSPEWLRRQAVRWANAQGVNVQVLYPTLGTVLRQARKGGKPTGKVATMKRRANESLEVAAPDARIDVEAPVKNVTDADAQASQYDLSDFAHNAGDDIADPDLSTDSQFWAPGEGDKKEAHKKAGGVAAVRYAEAVIKAGLADEDERWKLARQAETMKEAVVIDRTRLLEAVAAKTAATSTRTAAVNRTPAMPRGLTAPTRVASTRRMAEHDPSNDSALFY